MLWCVLIPSLLFGQADSVPLLNGFRHSAWFNEQVREAWLEDSVRVVVNVPGEWHADRPARLILYATPNGNTLEQTLGSRRHNDTDWHFDIQHVAAQVRKYRTLYEHENVAVAVIEAEDLSWPAWKSSRSDAPARITRVVDTLRQWLPTPATVTLAAHSGGGSFLFGLLDAADTLPEWIDRCIFLDANYGYDDTQRHGDKLLAWLNGGPHRRLIVVAYDDREVTLNGKKVVSSTGGTFRATERLRRRLEQDLAFTDSEATPFRTAKALDGRVVLHVHPNPQNKILHTALVGEMNGLLEGLCDGTATAWGTFGGPRAYSEFVQPPAGIPHRPKDALSGAAVMERVATLRWRERERIVTDEIVRGNLPEFLRQWCTIETKFTDDRGAEHVAKYEVLPDYLSVGGDDDFVRVPLTPQAAERIAEGFGAALPTRKMVDDIARQAMVRLAPQPLTQNREAVATFVQHHQLIEQQFGDRPRGGLLAGIKKDVVVSNRLDERPHRLALYGWHQLDWQPIQPLTIVHVDWYVDYSHGVRLVKRTMTVDGKRRDLRHVQHDAKLWPLVSDEGPLRRGTY